jgi:hypothetical protein
MFHTNFKIQEERLTAIETKPIEQKAFAVRQTSPSPENNSPKGKAVAEGPYATIGDMTKKIHALKKAFKAIEDHTLASE